MPETVSSYATWAYSRIRPPSQSRRRTRVRPQQSGAAGRPADASPREHRVSCGISARTVRPCVGVSGTSTSGEGVHAHSDTGNGVHGDSGQSDAVVGITLAKGKAGVLGLAPDGNAVAGISDRATGVFGQTKSAAGFAGFFEGNVQITGNVTCEGDIFLPGADCAEEFDLADSEQDAEPGTVVILDKNSGVKQSHQSYDKNVAGVISGAGQYQPGIVLGRRRAAPAGVPIALNGRTFCKVDAEYAAIEVGDLLTTSETPGHAMKATDPARAFGAVIGKALQPFVGGQGLTYVATTMRSR